MAEGKILVPPNIVKPNVYDGLPFYFFGGPGDSNNEAEIFRTMQKFEARDFVAAIPREWGTGHLLAKHFLAGLNPAAALSRDDDTTDLLRWKRTYSEVAAKKGCLIFWLPREMRDRRKVDIYEHEIFLEIGEWLGRLIYDLTLRVVVGMDHEIHPLKLRTVEQNFTLALGHRFPIYASWESAVRAAIEKAH